MTAARAIMIIVVDVKPTLRKGESHVEEPCDREQRRVSVPV